MQLLTTGRTLPALLAIALALTVAACTPVQTAPPAASAPPAAAATMPASHTACAEGVDLTGQTIRFYHLLDPSNQVDTAYDSVQSIYAGYADAAATFNAHGGICGAAIEHVFDDPQAQAWAGEDVVYQHIATLDPKPPVLMIYGTGVADRLAGQLAADEIPALNMKGGGTEGAFGTDGQALEWVFATNPLYTDQAGTLCDYIAANPDRYPNPVLGFLSFDAPLGAWGVSAGEDARPYCTALGIGDAGAAYFYDTDLTVQDQVQQLVDAGANILYTNSQGNGPALIAKTLGGMGLRDMVTLAAVGRAMTPYAAFLGMADLDAAGLPLLDGMLGSVPMRTWAETNHPGIQLIRDQADAQDRPVGMHTDEYILGWNTTDLLIETYIQTGNRVGFDALTGPEIKRTLENLVYAPLGGVTQIDYQGGSRNATTANRIGVVHYLGADGKTAADAGNLPMQVAEEGQQFLVPLIVPLTDFQAAPDLRPGGEDVVTQEVTAAPAQPECPYGDGGTCLGDLSAGTYATASFEPSLTYTIPDGWTNVEDLRGNFLLQRVSDRVEGTGAYLGVYRNIGAPDGCIERPDPNVGRSVAELIAWYQANAELTVTPPQTVTIGGLSGVYIDVNVAPGAQGCVFGPASAVAIIVGAGPSSLHHVLPIPNWPERLYLLATGENDNVVIEVGPEGGNLPDYLAAVEPVIASFQFGD